MASNFKDYHALRGHSALHQGGYLRRAKEVLYQLQRVLPSNSFSVLDIGTADGIMMEYLQQAFPAGRFVGVEKNIGLLKVAEDKGLNVIRADAKKLPFPQSHFDAVILVSTLKHIPDHGRVLGEVHRVLRPQGHLIVSDPTPLGLQLGLWRGHFDPTYLAHRWSLKELQREVVGSGFRTLAAHRYMPLPVMFPGSDQVERALSRIGCTQLFMQQVLVAQRIQVG